MLAVALIIVVALVAAGGVWYWRAHKSNANPSQSQDASAIQTTSTYQNTDYGISFDYPNNWTVKPADAAEGDYGLYTPYGPYQNASTTVSLVTVEISPSLYPGTNLKGAYFNLSVNKQLNQSQCLALTSQPGPNNGGGKITIGGVVFNWTRAGSTAAGTDEFSENYSGYTNGTCYEFNLGDATGNDVSPTGTRMSGSANDIPALEGVLSSVKFAGLTSTSEPVSATNNFPVLNIPTTSTLVAYKDSQYGFQISYPNSFSFATSSRNGIVSYSISDPQVKKYYTIISITNDPSYLATYDQEHIFTGPYPIINNDSDYASNVVIQKIMNGISGVEEYGYGSNQEQGGSSYDEFIFKHNGYVWTLSMDLFIEGHSKDPIFDGTTNVDASLDAGIYHQILGSFELTK